MTRTLRSGKPLPDPPPVKKGSLGSVTSAKFEPPEKPSAVTTPRKCDPPNKSPVVVTPTTELRRSQRCPKKKPAPVVLATMAVERDSLPYLEKCKDCGEEFKKRALYVKHCRSHKINQPVKNERKSAPPAISVPVPIPTPQPSPPPTDPQPQVDSCSPTQIDDIEKQNDPELIQQLREHRPIIDFTRKRPSLPSLAMKDPVTCEECGMTFTRRAHLNRHRLLHAGVILQTYTYTKHLQV